MQFSPLRSQRHTGTSTSLDLLLSQRATIPNSPNHTKTSRLLEKHSISISLAITPSNNNNNNTAYTHLTPHHLSSFPGGLTITKQDLQSCRSQIAINNPDIHVRVLNVTSQVDEKRGRAKVWVSGHVSNCQQPDLTARESIQVYSWRWLGEAGWMCFQSEFLHGVTGLEETGQGVDVEERGGLSESLQPSD